MWPRPDFGRRFVRPVLIFRIDAVSSATTYRKMA